MNGKTSLRIVSALVLIAAIAGIAFIAFRAGVAQGWSIAIEAPSGESVPAPYPYYGYGPRLHQPFGFGFGCFGILIPIFLFFLVFGAFRFLFWGPRWGWHRHYGMHGRGWSDNVPMFDEWHKKAHNIPNGGGETTEDKKE